MSAYKARPPTKNAVRNVIRDDVIFSLKKKIDIYIHMHVIMSGFSLNTFICALFANTSIYVRL